MNRKKLIRFDWAMKYILRNKANFDVLEGFLSNLLKEDVKIQEILESESNQDDDGKNKCDDVCLHIIYSMIAYLHYGKNVCNHREKLSAWWRLFKQYSSSAI